MQPAFVVGTGRCGSTLVSRMLRAHPDVLSLSELFAALGARAFLQGPVDADTFWRILSEPRSRTTTMLRHGLAVEEFLYPFEAGGRFDAGSGVPPISLTALPFLDSEPDELLDEVEREARRYPRGSVGSHYRRLFEWLAARFGKSRWVERSGGSLRLVPDLVAAFPGARFVHLHRDGRACAHSMSRHHNFRMSMIGAELAQELGFDPYQDDAPAVRELDDSLAGLLPQRFDRRVYDAHSVSLSWFGRLWSGQVVVGCRELAGLPAGRVMTLAYEQLLASPATEVERMASFLEIEAPDGWVESAAAMCWPDRSSWMTLPDEQRHDLEQACALGMRVLGRHKTPAQLPLPI